MPITEHLRELRNRLIVYLVFLLPFSVAAFLRAKQIIEWLLLPAGGRIRDLIVMSPGEALFTFIKVGLAAGFIITSPVLLYEVAAFVSPALAKRERRLLMSYIPVVLGLFLLGCAFGFFAFLPVVLHFLLSFATAPFKTFFSLSRYIGFVLDLTLPFGLVFELPVAAYALARAGVLEPGFLRRQRRVAILIIFIIAGAITPPDALSMMLMVVPMLVLYEVSILMAQLAVRQRRRVV